MAELDRRLVEEFHMDLSMLMENAGRLLATHARTMVDGEGKKMLVMVGKGNNGGGGMVAARNLQNWGEDVEIVLATSPKDFKALPLRQFEILRRMGANIIYEAEGVEAARYDLIVDALLGYNQRGNPRGAVSKLVRITNNSREPVLCLDIPTGLDPDSGRANNPCIAGTQTLTLALPKKGLVQRRAKPYVGDLFLADIGVPLQVYRELGVPRSIFQRSPIVKLTL
jgi:NAD(P)H-hydrate epimerase